MSLKKALLSSSALRLQESAESMTALERAIDHLESLAAIITLEPQECLLRQGEEGDRFYVVIEGSVIAKDETSGQVLHTFESGDRFGERWLLFPHEPAGATCAAGDNGATLKSLSRACFQHDFANMFITVNRIRGRIVRAKTTKPTRYLDRDVCEFRGIEYATRTSRFALPAVKVYDGKDAFDAFENGPECVQVGGALFDQFAPQAPKRSKPSLLQFIHNRPEATPNERCLVLNVYTPLGSNGQISTTKLPVMVWIHGGAFITGSCSIPMYDGRELASKGVVVIAINYRLGALGFLAGAADIPINLGLHDQVAALRWVKQHAHMFGGDADNITVFGESAGGMSVSCLLGMKVRRQEKLFHKAIVQSGNAHAVLSQSQGLKIFEAFSGALLNHLRLPRETIVDKALLESIALADLMKVTETVARGMVDMSYLRGVLMPFQPVCFENGPIGADLLFECVTPLSNISRGIADDVTMMIGMTNNEYTLFMLDNYWRKLLTKSKNSKKAFKKMLSNKLINWASAEDLRYRPLANLEQRAQAVIDFYLPDGSADELNDDDASLAFERLHTAWLFGVGEELLIMSKAGDGGGLPVYTYRLHLLCPMNQLGSPHALDLPLVFGTFKTDRLASMLSGDGPEAIQCSMEMMKAWSSFAKTGNPGWSPLVPRIFGAEPGTHFPEIGKSIFLHKKERAVWDGFLHRGDVDLSICRTRAKI